MKKILKFLDVVFFFLFFFPYLNLSVMYFPICELDFKHTLFLPLLHVFAPLNDVRAYIACLVIKNNPNQGLRDFFIIIFNGIQIQVPPPRAVNLISVENGVFALFEQRSTPGAIAYYLLCIPVGVRIQVLETAICAFERT